MVGKYGIGGMPASAPSTLPKKSLSDRVFDALTPKPAVESPAPAARKTPGMVGDVTTTVNAIKARNKALKEVME